MRQSTSKEDEQPCSGLPTCVLETEMDGVCVCSVAVSLSHPTGQQQRPPSHSRHGQGQTRATLGSGCLMSTVTGPDTEDHRPKSENNDAEMKAPSKGTHTCFCSMRRHSGSRENVSLPLQRETSCWGRGGKLVRTHLRPIRWAKSPSSQSYGQSQQSCTNVRGGP